MAERIRLNAALGGVIVICVELKNFLRICPPLTCDRGGDRRPSPRASTAAIRRALDGHPKDVDFRASSSLAMGGVASG